MSLVMNSTSHTSVIAIHYSFQTLDQLCILKQDPTKVSVRYNYGGNREHPYREEADDVPIHTNQYRVPEVRDCHA